MSDDKKAQWGKFKGGDPRLDGAALLYGGRTLEFRVFLNTDEPVDVVLERIRAVASGPKKVMTTIMVNELHAEMSKALWEVLWKTAGTVAGEKERPSGN